MNWEAIKPLVLLLFTSALKIVGGALVTHGIVSAGPGLETFTGAAMAAGGAFWSWWIQSGHLQAAAYLKKLTDTATQAAAIAVAKQMAPAAVTGAAEGAKAAVAVAKVVLVAFMLSVLIAPSAFAQSRPKLTGNIAADIANATTKPGVALTGNVQQDLQALWQKIVTSSLADLNYAAAMAASANTTTSAIRLQCVKAIIQLNEQASGANLKNADGSPMVKPDPHLFTDVESLAEIIDNLSPQGPLFVSCAGAAQLAKTNVLTFVNGVVTGVAGFAAMPVIPGL